MKLSRPAAEAIVDKKARDEGNSRDEISALVQAYCADELDEGLMIEWLRAVVDCGMTVEETASLTQVMAQSGQQLEWPSLPAAVVDKHSTGGVGDDVSLIAVPLVAACGLKVAKLSGTALGHTGGTLDKLEQIPGLRTALSMQEFKAQVSSSVGCAIAQASAELAPADKKLYQLRHRSGTIASVPLITASILSKKIAGGAPSLVIDVKAGSCAFMQSLEEAESLAASLLEVGTRLGRRMEVLLTDMDAPLADSIGDHLELAEALETLEHARPSRLREVALAVATAMITITGEAEQQQARASVERALQDGSAFRRFELMARTQGGDLGAFDRSFKPNFELTADSSGFIEHVDGRYLGGFIVEQKRLAKGVVGLKLLMRRGDAVEKNEPVLQAFGIALSAEVASKLRAAVGIGPRRLPEGPAVIKSRRGQPRGDATPKAV